MAKLPWFKHYNTASTGQLVGDLIAQKQYDAALLFFNIMELISIYEDADNPNERGKCTVPMAIIVKRMNMKPSKIQRLLTRISLVSRSDLICTMSEEQPRNVSFLMRNWLKLQETRGGKRWSKTEQNPDRSKKLEVRSKNEEEEEVPGGSSTAPEAKIKSRVSLFEATEKKRTASAAVWVAYSSAYEKRYGTAPVRNATVNSQLAAFVGRVGEAEAPLVADFYVRSQNQFYVRQMHSVGMLLKDAEKLRTEWKTGRNTGNGFYQRQTTANERTENLDDKIAEMLSEEK